MKKSAIITGITGQDGSYLAELLCNKGYSVIGVYRRSSNNNFQNITELMKRAGRDINFGIIEGDMTDPGFIARLVESEKADEFYNLAAQSHVGTSFNQPSYTHQVNTVGVLNILEAIRQYSPSTRFYQASTSEMFGKVVETPQTEKTPFYPRSPYAVSKLAAHWMVVNYRESYGLFACSGILFNHESERRGENFVTKVIAKQIAEIAMGLKDTLLIGNTSAKRDWGYAPDYVEAMWLMLQQDQPEDFVIATGKTHSVQDFIEECAKAAGIKDINLKVVVDASRFRPAEVDLLQGDYTKAKNILGWQPKTEFNELVKKMVLHEMKNL